MTASTDNDEVDEDTHYSAAYQKILLAITLKTIDIPNWIGSERRLSIADYQEALREAELIAQPELIARLQNNLACRLFGKGQRTEALTLLQWAVGWVEEQHEDYDPHPGNPNDETTVVIVSNLDSAQVAHKFGHEYTARLQRARRYMRRGERTIADALYEISSRYSTAHLGIGHWVLACILCEWAVCQRRMGNQERAIALLNEAAPIVNRWSKRHMWLPEFFIANKKQVIC